MSVRVLYGGEHEHNTKSTKRSILTRYKYELKKHAPLPPPRTWFFFSVVFCAESTNVLGVGACLLDGNRNIWEKIVAWGGIGVHVHGLGRNSRCWDGAVDGMGDADIPTDGICWVDKLM